VRELNQRKEKKENQTTPRNKDKVKDVRDKIKSPRSEIDRKERHILDPKSPQRIDGTPENTRDVVTKPLRGVRLAPRAVVRQRTLSCASSDRATSQGGEKDSPQAHFDMYNTMFSEAIGDERFAHKPAHATPPGPFREYTSPPHSQSGGVFNYDVWAAPASGSGKNSRDMWGSDARSTTGLHSHNLFSFPSDGAGIRAGTSLRASEPFSPQSASRSGWQSMLSQWEEREDRDERSRSWSHEESFSQ
jgi:hypothetical protein